MLNVRSMIAQPDNMARYGSRSGTGAWCRVCYCNVALIVIIDVPELNGPLPVAWTEKVSLPLYPAFDL